MLRGVAGREQMAKFTGTNKKDTITPDSVSAGVTVFPLGSTPGTGPDQLFGFEGTMSSMAVTATTRWTAGRAPTP